ncbi:hypothetical protein EXA20_17035 [Vibrio cincinnatiensis]|uniref:hypothetical protein n=2 Tax=Vibrio cincinnatiensis TaxID=675 RepID=UPI0012ACFB43|nr:hypothetical protein [Vibrio cincinnatiensis]MCG3737961.1 hypothetical protein [Vibrio cincinnatiensis]MCG3745403.1 hypothetical protein [Vibrio cincinnatiensis]MCG3748667.1 hypothetical protein [Vibrio cincinnatiensis]
MSWAKLKTGIIIVLVILISEAIRLYTGLPITIIDIGVLPITCLLIYCMKYYKSPFSKTYKDTDNHQQQTPLQLIGFLLFTIILAAMGSWIAWLGIQAPLQYFSSVKGAAHGYTLIQIGGLTALYSMWGVLVFLFRLVSLRDKSA